MISDATLLKQYAKTRDADAFAELVRRHSGMVYGACLRATGSPQDAEDLAQQCFIELARNAGSITLPLARWLHLRAASRSVDAIRSAAARGRHEEQAMAHKDDSSEPTWDDIAPHIDRALAEMSQELSVPLTLHFLRGQNQDEIATELGIDQSTVSRRMDKGLDELRKKLGKAGVIASLALLTTCLTQNAATAAPIALTASLGKLAMAGLGGEVAGGTAAAASTMTGWHPAGATSRFLGTMWGKVAAVLIVTAIL